MKKVMELKNVSLIYQTPEDEVTAIDGLTFDCKEGDFLSIIGPSGCGKTSILSLIAGLIKPTSGTIKINGVTENQKPNFGYMFQKDHLFSWRTIEKNVLLPLEIKRINTKENREFALSLLEKYGLIDFRNKFPDQLSGGMRQRVALIRTLVSKPDILLLDEPFSALDYQTRLSVCEDVYQILKNEKKTTVLVTHDISEAISMSDIIIVLSARPAQVKSIYSPDINLPSPIARRETVQFANCFKKIWEELH